MTTQQAADRSGLPEEFDKVSRFYDAHDANGDLFLASADFEMDSLSERGADWILAEDYDRLLAAHKAALRRIQELESGELPEWVLGIRQAGRWLSERNAPLRHATSFCYA